MLITEDILNIPKDKIDFDPDWLNRIAPCPNIVWGGTSCKSWVDPKRIIYDHELMLFGAEGKYSIGFESVRLDIEPHSFVIIPPGLTHLGQGHSSTSITRAWMHFDWVFQNTQPDTPILTYSPATPKMDRIKKAPGFIPDVVLNGPIKNPSYIFELHERIRQQFNYGNSQERLESRSLALELLLRLLCPLWMQSKSKTESHPMQQLRMELQNLAMDDFQSAPTIRQFMQQKIGRHHEHLARQFKKAYGVTPLTFVNSLRVERAKSLLRDTNLTIQQIAENLGFRDAVYFARLFRKYTRLSPTQFRNLKPKK